VNVFIDTNVLLDVLGRREPFYTAAAQVWSLAERDEIQAFVSAISFNNVYYIVRKAEGRAKADAALRMLRGIFHAVAPDAQILNQAIDARLGDFEDALQFHSAIRIKATHLITRDPDDFPKTDLLVLSPEEFMALWREQQRPPANA
jgi:predicted nucleic acid-binding protein